MRKNIKIIILTTIILFGTAISLALIVPYFKEEPSQQLMHVRIYVNSTIHDQILSEITQYKQDIVDQGYTAELITWSDNNITKLRNDLINASLQPLGLFGAVLIGNFPIAIIENNDAVFGFEVFPTDLYLMDLDGLWTNTDIDSNFESHTAGSGDIFPEIWIGRINPECMNNLNHLKAYQDYFSRNHDYRNGNLTRPHSQLIYIDDAWASPSEATEWIGDMTAYSNLTSVYTPTTSTNETDYLNRLSQNYEFIHLLVHSDSTQHYFGGDGSEGFLTNTEILNLYTKPLFYNLFACYGCRITNTNNIGTQYLFSNNTLAVIGSTKAGGMTMNSFFYTPLSQGKVFGEAFRLWWWNDDGIVSHGPDDPWSMGMVLLGDPLLTILM